MATNPTVERPVIRRRSYLEPAAVRRRERQQFGRRTQWDAVFFGLVATLGMIAMLVAIVLGGLIAAGVGDFGNSAASQVHRLSVGGGTILMAILALSYLAGGYVAARMARFDGWRQGLGVWLLTALVLLAVAVSAWIGGAQLDPAKSISLPANPIHTGPLTDGWIAAAAIALITLVFGAAGGVVGDRFHRAIDRVGLEPELGEGEPGAEPEERDSEGWEPDADEGVETTVVQGTA
ncbi:MAG: hypothetical protein ACJ75Z_06160 [Solirubrobacterales bacterium]